MIVSVEFVEDCQSALEEMASLLGITQMLEQAHLARVISSLYDCQSAIECLSCFSIPRETSQIETNLIQQPCGLLFRYIQRLSLLYYQQRVR